MNIQEGQSSNMGEKVDKLAPSMFQPVSDQTTSPTDLALGTARDPRMESPRFNQDDIRTGSV